jgi:biopolymer transport protein ExbB/TolQ
MKKYLEWLKSNKAIVSSIILVIAIVLIGISNISTRDKFIDKTREVLRDHEDKITAEISRQLAEKDAKIQETQAIVDKMVDEIKRLEAVRLRNDEKIEEEIEKSYSRSMTELERRFKDRGYNAKIADIN